MNQAPSRPIHAGSTTAALTVALALAPPAGAQLTVLGADILYEDVGAVGTTENLDRFGDRVAVGDFNHDGLDDLAVGVPGETVSGEAAAGAVHVYYGGPGGLKITGDQVFTQSTTGIPGTPEAGDHFGAALAVGDWNSDGIDDLVIGVPDENLGSVVDAGTIVLLFGRNGQPLSGDVSFFKDNPCPETGDRYGFALALGRTSTLAYVAVGAPGRTVDLLNDDAGAVEFVRCTIPDCAILVGIGCFTYNQNTFFVGVGDMADDAETGDMFGWSLATGDFDGDGEDDLAIGVLFENIGSIENAGAVNVLYSEGDGFRLDNDDFWHQDVTGVVDTAESGDRFGGALVAGDFDGDGLDDLAVGVAGESVNGFGEAGAVHLLYSGGSGGLSTTGDQLFVEDDLGAGGSETGDHFGAVLARGDFNGDGEDDLPVGVPDENYTGIPDGGRVKVLYGGPTTGIGTTGHQSFDQDVPAGMPDGRESGDHFGAALAAGDFDGNGFDDLAIGTPGEDVNTGGTDEGMVTVLYSVDPDTGGFGTAHFSTGAVTFSESAGVRPLLVFRDGGAPVSASVDRVRSGGTATPGVDFTYTDGSESWNAGEIGFESFAVTIKQDRTDEPNETLVIQLTNPTAGLALGTPATLTITIEDDDPAGMIFWDDFESQNFLNWSSTAGGA